VEPKEGVATILEICLPTRKKAKRYFFLFNDVMLLCKKKGQKSGKYYLRVHITLRSPFVEVEDVKTVSSHRMCHCMPSPPVLTY
jgi:hypothetical protein